MKGNKVTFKLYNRVQTGVITVWDTKDNYMEVNNGVEDYRLDIDHFLTIVA